MTVSSAASAHSKKLIKLTLSLFRNGFNSSKCKTAAKMAVARIKLLRNKRQVVVKQMRRDIALLLQSGQDATARIRVEHVIREQNILAANEFIELFCELVVSRLSIIAKRRECPADLKEGISSLIFAAPRCAEIPELVALRNIFEKKYGKDFVSAATDLRPTCGVNRLLIDKLSVKTPSGEVKLKVMKEIAKEHNIEWDMTESENELLKPPEELIEGPRNFVSASSLTVKPATNHSLETKEPMTREEGPMQYKDMVSAAEAAQESAKRAIAAAQAATYLANRDGDRFNESSGCVKSLNDSSIITRNLSGSSGGAFVPTYPPDNFQHMDHQYKVDGTKYESHSQSFERSHYPSNAEARPNNDCIITGNLSGNSGGAFVPTYPPVNFQHMDHQYKVDGTKYESHSQSFKRSHYPSNEEARPNNFEGGKTCRRNSYNASSANSDIKFDESGCDEEIEVEDGSGSINLPPERSPPHPPLTSSHGKQDSLHRVHPNLPVYDDLEARFEALWSRK